MAKKINKTWKLVETLEPDMHGNQYGVYKNEAGELFKVRFTFGQGVTFIEPYTKRVKSVRESTIEEYFETQVKAAGGLTRKLKYIGTHGAPDRLVLFPNTLIFVELKRPTKDLNEHQAREFNRLKSAGALVEMINSKLAVDGFIRKYRKAALV